MTHRTRAEMERVVTEAYFEYPNASAVKLGQYARMPTEVVDKILAAKGLPIRAHIDIRNTRKRQT